MPTYGTINGTTYTDQDFIPDAYANRLNALLGDIYDHDTEKYGIMASATLAIGTGAKSFSITNNKTGSTAFLSPGQFVYIRPTGYTGNTPNFRAFMAGTVTSVSTGSIAVNATVARGLGTFSSWTITPIGDLLTSFSSPLPIAQGGTGQSTAIAARNALGVPDPSNGMQVLFEDFCGSWRINGIDQYLSESFIVSRLADPNFPMSGNNPVTGSYFIRAPQQIFQGEGSVYNAGDGGGGSGAPAPGPGASGISGDWASRPGVIGFSGISAGSKLSMAYTKADVAGNAVFTGNNAYAFPVTGDVFEFSFMVPRGEGFDLTNTGGFCIGFFPTQLNGYGIWFNLGNMDALPFGNLDDTQGYASDPSTFGPMTACIMNAQRDAVSSTVWVDGSAQNTALVIQEGRWYKVRVLPTSAAIYSDGAILYKSIAGWTNPTMGPTKGSNLQAFYYKRGGNKRVTVLLDYLYFRHPVVR